MPLHDVLGDRESQARASAAARPVGFVKAFENAGQVVRIDAGPIVVYCHDDPPAAPQRLRRARATGGRQRPAQLACADPDLPARRRELDRVVYQVGHDALRTLGIGHQRRQLWQIDDQVQPCPLGLRTQPLYRRDDDLCQRGGLQPQRDLVRFDARQLEQLLDHLRQRVHLALHAVEETPRCRRVIQRTIAQRVDQRLEPGQGRPQLVRDVADEIAPHRLQPADARQILQDGQIALHPRLAKRLDDRLQKEPLQAPLHHAALLLLLLAAALPQLDQLVVAHGLHERGPHGPLWRRIEQPCRSRVDQVHPSFSIGDNDPARRVLEHRRQAALLARQRIHLAAQLVGHVVKSTHELCHLVAPDRKQARVQVPRCQPLGDRRQAPQGTRRPLGDGDRQPRREQRGDERADQQRPP